MAKSLGDLIPDFIREIHPYKPGRPIEEVERELRIRAVKLASNENPLGPSPLGIEAARKALEGAHRYPDGGGYYLREKLSARLGMPASKIILGNGSTDLIDLAARSLLHDGDEGLTSEGSFPLYYISIRASGARLVTVPLRDDAFDLDAVARAVTPRTKLIYLANPNNPTGTMFTASEFEAFFRRLPDSLVVVLDEAYYEYVERRDYPASLDLVREGRNLLVLRTFSKVYGLAGVRIGYGMGPEPLLEAMNKIRLPFNTAGTAQAAAFAALEDEAHVRRSIEANRAGLEQLSRGLARLGVRFVPSVANFLLVEFESEAEPIADALLRAGVIVRPMKWMGFPNGIRVSVGLAGENDKFLRALGEILAGQNAPSAGRGEGRQR
jgi:histidinol-phosphate aminotransferase